MSCGSDAQKEREHLENLRRLVREEESKRRASRTPRQKPSTGINVTEEFRKIKKKVKTPA